MHAAQEWHHNIWKSVDDKNVGLSIKKRMEREAKVSNLSGAQWLVFFSNINPKFTAFSTPNIKQHMYAALAIWGGERPKRLIETNCRVRKKTFYLHFRDFFFHLPKHLWALRTVHCVYMQRRGKRLFFLCSWNFVFFAHFDRNVYGSNLIAINQTKSKSMSNIEKWNSVYLR